MSNQSSPSPPQPDLDSLLGLAEGPWRDLALPGLLFLAGHRPLAFLLGQGLLWLEPLLAWALPPEGRTLWQGWARQLSHPQGPDTLEKALDQLSRRGAP